MLIDPARKEARRASWAKLPYLRTILNVVSFVETQVAQVVGWRSLAGLAGLRRERQV